MPSHDRSTARTERGLRQLAPLALAAIALGACGSAHGVRRSDASSSSTATHRVPVVGDTRASILAAIGACKRGVDTAQWLPRESREDLYRTCAGGLNYSIFAEREVGKLACEEVAYAAPSPSAAAKARAFDACYAEVKPWTTVTPKPR